MSQDNSALGFTVFEAEEAEVTLGHLIAFLFTFSLILIVTWYDFCPPLPFSYNNFLIRRPFVSKLVSSDSPVNGGHFLFNIVWAIFSRF